MGSVFSRSFRISDAVGRGQLVEKVAAEPIYGFEPDSKCPKTALSAPERGSEKGTKEFFNKLSGVLGSSCSDPLHPLYYPERGTGYKVA